MKDDLNALEPKWFLEAWQSHPPEGFKADRFSGGPYFEMKFDLLTTLEPQIKRWIQFLAPLLPKPKTIFFGQTNSEYCFLNPEVTAAQFASEALQVLSKREAACAIVKDLPAQSPLLSSIENTRSSELREQLLANGFQEVTGEALAFIPITFTTISEFMTRFSGNRRRQLQKKLRARALITIEEKTPGQDFISTALVDQVYRLFEQVYAQSEMQFDKLSKGFFEALLNSDRPEARLFLYYEGDKLIAFTYNLVYNNKFIYKYIGFDYSRSRDLNMYYVTWFHMLEYCLRFKLTDMIAGWTDVKIKAYLGSHFTYTYHFVYFRNGLLRWILSKFKKFFEADRTVLEQVEQKVVQ
jgi:predicted N-acyltransferase